jgi:PKD repeat protein
MLNNHMTALGSLLVFIFFAYYHHRELIVRLFKMFLKTVFLNRLWSLAGVSCLLIITVEGHAVVLTPQLKWQHGGCYSSWCETGWYSSPVVADLDGDGKKEVIAGAYSIFILKGTDGSTIKTIDPDGSRVWPGVVVADIDNDGNSEIVTAHGGGYLHVFDHTGASEWSKRPSDRELRGLSVHDLNGDGTMEIIVTAAVGSKTNTWVYSDDGQLQPGWPQLVTNDGYAYGVFNDNASVGDLDGDGEAEIVVTSDVHYICAYYRNGTSVLANAMYGGKHWGKVGIWESLDTELQGWGTCSSNDLRAERYRTNFAHGPSVISDVNGDCIPEVIAVGNVYDCAYGHPPGKYNGVYIFNADRSRFNTGAFDWRQVPVDTGAPLSEDYNEIENCQPNPVVADIDSDGFKEILFSSYDGKVHCYWLDKTERHNWPFSVYDSTEGVYRFASEPVAADLDNDGRAEVLVATWVEKGSYSTGSLYILDYRGNPVHEVSLPQAFGSSDWNGGLAAPTLDNIDNDTDLEAVINTAHSGVVAYDLPGSANARLQWETGRGSYLRNGSFGLKSSTPEADFAASITEGKEPLSVVFSDRSSGCISSRTWDFGDGAVSSNTNPVHTFLSLNEDTTSYTVSLEVFNPFNSDSLQLASLITVHPCLNDPVRILKTAGSQYENSIQTAYDNHASSGDSIDIQAMKFQGPLTVNRNIHVKLMGGLGCDFQKTAGYSSVTNKLTISKGQAVVEKVVIVP